MALQFACSAAATADDVDTGCSCNLDGLPWGIQDLLDAASDALVQVSGGAVTGRCEATLRPCSDGGCACGFGPYCHCCSVEGIPLIGYINPVVTEVKIDGELIAEDLYKLVVVNGTAPKLVRTDGTYWPGAKNPLRPDTEDGTFSVTLTHGSDFGFIGKMAAVELVCEMALVLGAGTGRLPPGTVAATMDNVQVVVGRLPGRQDVEAVGLSWLARFMDLGGAASQAATVYTPEMSEGWTLIQELA